MDNRYFSKKIIEWYQMHQRSLPWRLTTDPYKIWLSEIILQQTRVAQGLPYYLKFVESFPTIDLLANASEQRVLRLWQGLGYYTRARNLHKCAKEIVGIHKGIFPDSFEKLKALPGVGDYTAAAIASFAFKENVAVVDGNVFRVLARLFGIDKAINSPDGKKYFTRLANELISSQYPDLHNQAIMEFGAMYCVPKNPDCPECIFKESCFAYKNELQHVLPIKIKAKQARKRYFYYFVIKKGKSFLMKKRDQKDIWFGLYDFFLIEKNRPVKIEKLIAENDMLKKLNRTVQPQNTSGIYKHVLSHQIILARFTSLCTTKSFDFKDKNLKYFTSAKVADLPKPVLITRFLEGENLL